MQRFLLSKSPLTAQQAFPALFSSPRLCRTERERALYKVRKLAKPSLTVGSAIGAGQHLRPWRICFKSTPHPFSDQVGFGQALLLSPKTGLRRSKGGFYVCAERSSQGERERVGEGGRVKGGRARGRRSGSVLVCLFESFLFVEN